MIFRPQWYHWVAKVPRFLWRPSAMTFHESTGKTTEEEATEMHSHSLHHHYYLHSLPCLCGLRPTQDASDHA